MTQQGTDRGRFGDLGVRAVSGVVLGAISLGLVWIGGLAAALLAAVLLCLLLWEFHRIVTGSSRLAVAPLFVLQAGGILACLLLSGGAAAVALAVFLAAVLTASTLAREHFLWIAGGSLYIGGAMGGLLHIRLDAALGFWVLVWIVVVVIAADVGAYFTGRMIGGRKLCPSISPGKTRSGAAGGLLSALVFSAVHAGALGWPIAATCGAGLVVALASQAGDLLESWVKRRAGVKDSGVLLPGHGGFLDRLDGVLGGSWAFLLLWALGFGQSLQ